MLYSKFTSDIDYHNSQEAGIRSITYMLSSIVIEALCGSLKLQITTIFLIKTVKN